MKVQDLLLQKVGNKPFLTYALEKMGKYNVRYVAHCIECGEMFDTSFWGLPNYTQNELLEIGQDVALGWGAECYAVERWV